MFYLRQVTDFLKQKLFGQQNIPPQLLQPHTRLDINRPSKPPTRVSQCVVACQVDLGDRAKESRSQQATKSVLSENAVVVVAYVDHKKDGNEKKVVVVGKSEEEEGEISVVGAFVEVKENIEETVKLEFDDLISKLADLQQSLSLHTTPKPPPQSPNSSTTHSQNLPKILSQYTSLKYPYQIYQPLLSLPTFSKTLQIWHADPLFSDVQAVTHANFNQKLTYKSLQTLSFGNWLNDEVVNCYVRMINMVLAGAVGRTTAEGKTTTTTTTTTQQQQHTKVVNSFFAEQIVSKDARGVARILNKNQIKPETVLIIPINKGRKHWYFVKMENGVLTVYDSLPSFSSGCISEPFREYLKKYHKLEKQEYQPSFPRQLNGNDCGVFMLMGIKSIALKEPDWAFSQIDMPYFRLLIAKEVLECRLAQRPITKQPC